MPKDPIAPVRGLPGYWQLGRAVDSVRVQKKLEASLSWRTVQGKAPEKPYCTHLSNTLFVGWFL